MKFMSSKAQGQHLPVELLSDLLDNQLSVAERSRAEVHLQSCASCQQELNSLRQTVKMLQALPRVPVPRAFTLSQAMIGARERRTTVPWFVGVARVAGVVTALVMVAALGTFLMQRTQPGSTGLVAVAPAQVTTAPAAAQPAEVAVPAAAALRQATGDAPAPEQATVATDAAGERPAATTAPAAAAAAPAAKPASPIAPAPTRSAAAPTIAAAKLPSATSVPPAPAAALAAAPMSAGGTPGPDFGRGGGGGFGPGAGPQPTYAPPPPTAAPSAVFPADAGAVFSNGTSLWTLDRSSGLHRILQSKDLGEPSVSPDRRWIAYYVTNPNGLDLRAVRWDGTGNRLIAGSGRLPVNPTRTARAERFIAGALRWVPGTHTLLFEIIAQGLPAGPDSTNVEVWRVDVENAQPVFTLNLGTSGSAVFSPDGKRIAAARMASPSNPVGSLAIYNADGSNERRTLDKGEVRLGGSTFEGQMRWLPDSSGLLVAIVESFPQGPDTVGQTALYKITAAGESQLLSRLGTTELAWSPDATQLAYTRPVTETLENRNLVLASADGSGEKIYAAIEGGSFVSWSPDSRHFLYTSGFRAYAGTAGQAPVDLGDLFNVQDPRWITGDTIFYMAGQPERWLPTLWPVTGRATAVAELALPLMYSVTSRK